MNPSDISGTSSDSNSTTTKDKHNPPLNSTPVVDNILLKHRVLSKAQLRKKLPKTMEYGTMYAVLDCLKASKKITYDGNAVLWMPSNDKLDALDDASVILK